MANQASEENERLILLPHEIQRHILSFLPIEDVKRMSFASARWRRICNSAPKLIFDFDEFPEIQNKLNIFINLIDRTVASHDESNVDAFVLYLFLDGPPIDNNWILFAINHSVKELVLYGTFGEDQNLPVELFTCGSLVELDLAIENCSLMVPPNSIFLPNLKRLSFKVIKIIDAKFTQYLPSTCPKLEEFSLESCDLSDVDDLSIFGPKLRLLSLDNCFGIEGCSINVHAPSLLEFFNLGSVAKDYDIKISTLSIAYVDCETPNSVIRRLDRQCLSFIKMLWGISKTKSLSVYARVIQLLSVANDMWNLHRSLSFPNLEFLELDLWPTFQHAQMAGHLLSRCPNVQSLNIRIMMMPEDENLEMPIDEGGMEMPNNLDILNKLTEAFLYGLNGEESELKLVKFLLANASKLVILRIKVKGPENMNLILQEISTFEIVSPEAVLELSCSPPYL